MWKNIERKLFRLRYLVLVVGLVACGGAFGTHTAGGESHFLRQCSEKCGDGLECVSGVCTRGCLVAEGGCGDLAPGAVCTAASIEPGAIAVCDVSCDADRHCAALGAGFSCAGGFCRGPALLGGGPSNHAGSSNAGSSNAGSSGAGASTDSSGGGAVSESGSGGQPGEPGCPKPAGEICHEFFVSDNARNQLSYINELDPTKSWATLVDDFTVNSPRQLELVDNATSSNGKAILVSVRAGYQEYDLLTGARLVNVVVAGTTGVRGAVRLPNGNTLLLVSDDKLRVVDETGLTVGPECTLPGAGSGSPSRIARDETTGQILFRRGLDLILVTETCQQQWTDKLPAGSNASAVLLRAGGGVWVSTGADATVLEYDQAGQIVSQVGGKDVHPDVGLDFFTDFTRLPSGNIVVVNWLGHLPSPNDDTPHVVEFTPSNKLVWRWGDQTLARQIVDVLVLR
ncbi:MAG TPA: hypothetical protein VJN18_07660 [Polyangiaceae bacterium]|nr:hypothetical protein [Polyangiaceae bacterium]